MRLSEMDEGHLVKCIILFTCVKSRPTACNIRTPVFFSDVRRAQEIYRPTPFFGASTITEAAARSPADPATPRRSPIGSFLFAVANRVFVKTVFESIDSNIRVLIPT